MSLFRHLYLPHSTHQPVNKAHNSLVHAVESCQLSENISSRDEKRLCTQGSEAVVFLHFLHGFPSAEHHPLWQCLRFPQMDTQQGPPTLSLPHDIHISLWFQENLTAIVSFVWPMILCLNEIMIMDRVIHGGYVCACRRNGLDLHVCHRNLILGNFCQSIFISGPFLRLGSNETGWWPFYKVAGERKAVLKDLVNHFFIKYLLHVY